MTLKALIIDDDPGIVDEVADIVESLGHVFDSASCMESARQRLAHGKYDYVLLDLEIPVRDGRTFARVQNGINLLREIRRDSATRSLPIVVMTGHGNDGPEQAVEVMRAGATDYIAKPFTRGRRTFDEIILEATASKSADTCSSGFPHDAQRQLTKFRGGELVFYPDRVELCGVMVCGRRGIMRTILDTLRERLPNGRYKAFSGEELARRAEADRGQNATAEAVYHFRQKVKKVLAEEHDLECGSCDIIENDRQHGYRLSDKVVCRDHDEPAPRSREQTSTPKCGYHEGPMNRSEPGDEPVRETVAPNGLNREPNGAAKSRNEPIGEPNQPGVSRNAPVREANRASVSRNEPNREPGNERQRWVLDRLAAGRRVQRCDLQQEFGVSAATAKRDFRALLEAGWVELKGSGKASYYRLTDRARQAQASASRATTGRCDSSGRTKAAT